MHQPAESEKLLPDEVTVALLDVGAVDLPLIT
jgi:hypothetical protein